MPLEHGHVKLGLHDSRPHFYFLPSQKHRIVHVAAPDACQSFTDSPNVHAELVVIGEGGVENSGVHEPSFQPLKARPARAA